MATEKTCAGDLLNGYLAAIILASLAGLNAYEFGRDMGRREAVSAMKCPGNSAYSLVDTRTGKCAIKGKKA